MASNNNDVSIPHDVNKHYTTQGVLFWFIEASNWWCYKVALTEMHPKILKHMRVWNATLLAGIISVLYEKSVGVKPCTQSTPACICKLKFISYIYIVLSFLSVFPVVKIDELDLYVSIRTLFTTSTHSRGNVYHYTL